MLLHGRDFGAGFRLTLSANVSETVDPKQFTVEGDQGRADENGA